MPRFSGVEGCRRHRARAFVWVAGSGDGDSVALWKPLLIAAALFAPPTSATEAGGTVDSTALCVPTDTVLQFDGGYKVNMCYRTPEGEVGQARSGIWASGQAGLLWFFDRDNAEVLVKVLDGCDYNGHRWAFVAPVTTLEFNLAVTASNGRRWTHSNRQGDTASTRSDVAAFDCADEPDRVAGLALQPSSRSGGLSPERIEAPALCVPTTTALHFDGGYTVSMCYRTPEGEVGQARSGIWASGQAGLLWFFDRDNAEVLVKVLDGCDYNGHRWAFVAPVTTLEFNLAVTASNGRRWTHSNRQGDTASTRSDVAAFDCADEPDSAADLVVEPPAVSDDVPSPGQSFTLSAVVRNQGDADSTSTALRWFQSSDSTIGTNDTEIDDDFVEVLGPGATVRESTAVAAPPGLGTYWYGACVDPVVGELRIGNNCSAGVEVTVSEPAAPDLVVSSVSVSGDSFATGERFTLSAGEPRRGAFSLDHVALLPFRGFEHRRLGHARGDGCGACAECIGHEFRVGGVGGPSERRHLLVRRMRGLGSGESSTSNNCSEVTVSEPARLISSFRPFQPRPR